MIYVLWAGLLFMASVAVHIIFCRCTARAGLQAKVYGLIAIVFLALYVLGALVEGQMIDPHSFWGAPFKITSGLVFILLVPSYLSFYVLTQLTSPSQKILLTVSQRGEASYEDLLACVREEGFIETRLADLCASGCVVQVRDKYVLSSRGRSLAAALGTMQNILGRQAGG